MSKLAADFLTSEDGAKFLEKKDPNSLAYGKNSKLRPYVEREAVEDWARENNVFLPLMQSLKESFPTLADDMFVASFKSFANPDMPATAVGYVFDQNPSRVPFLELGRGCTEGELDQKKDYCAADCRYADRCAALELRSGEKVYKCIQEECKVIGM